MVTANDPRVVSFYNFINGKPKNDQGYFIGSKQNETGLLYVIGGDHMAVQVWLPAELLDYANAAAGTSGKRAVGIRVAGFSSVTRAAEEVLRIFSSPEALAHFINTSECDYTGSTNRLPAKVIMPANPATADEFWNRYTKDILQNLITKYGRKIVQQAYNTLTMSEFEAMFELGTTQMEMA